MAGADTDEADGEIGGRLFFTNLRRGLVDEDEINLTSVGIDIGSSTSHLAFSRITLERADARYIVAARKLLFESDILLTPYADGETIDTEKLDGFFSEQYRLSGIGFADIDTGALILTGTALARRNARAIGDLFADAAGKFVAVSAGDEMEAVLAAFGSGAAALSAGKTVLNIDIGGGTTKIARCSEGGVDNVTALDVGARLLAFDENHILTRLEPAGIRIAQDCGVPLALGESVCEDDLDRLAAAMAERLMETIGAKPPTADSKALLRLPPLPAAGKPDLVTFSGGVSEYIYGREHGSFGDLGPRLAQKIADGIAAWGVPVAPAGSGIRATVIGASQYTVQVSGSTIYVSRLDVLPLRNVPTIKPRLELEHADPAAIAAAVGAALGRLGGEPGAVALCYSWAGSASFARIDAFAKGAVEGLGAVLRRGSPLILIGDQDVGGLIGLHIAEHFRLSAPVVSIDGIQLQEFDFVDIGTLLEGSGSLPVVVKSLVFPGASHGRKKSDGR